MHRIARAEHALLIGSVLPVVLALGASALAAPSPAGGPTPPPAKAEDWPGKGNVGVPGGWNQRRDGFWKDRKKDQNAVVFFGDSITEGWGSLAHDFKKLKVANRGISGDTSRGLLFRLQEDVLDLHPRAVSMLIGTNDLGIGSSPADVASNIKEILDAIAKLKPAPPVVVCHVMPRGAMPGLFPEKIKELNTLIDALVKDRKAVAICDTWTIFAQPDGACRADEFPDMLHPNAAGYAKWTAALTPVLARLGVMP